jgi:outer membrane protein TolC
MKAEKNVVLGLCFVLLVPLVNAQDSTYRLLSFDQALEISKQNSHVLKQMGYLQKEKNEEALATKGYYLPKIGITANYMFLSDDLHLDLNPVRDAMAQSFGAIGAVPVKTALLQNNWDKTIQEKQFGIVAATFQWPIYVGGKIRAANAASAIESRDVSEQTRQKDGELQSELTERYFGLCLAQQAYKVRSDVYKGMQKHLDDALKMEKQGLIANADVLHAKVFHAQSQRELNNAKRNVEIINEALLNSLAMDSVMTIQAISELFYNDSIEAVDYFHTLALEKSPLLKQVESKKELSIQNHKVQVSEFMPAVAFQGMYNIVDKDFSPYAPNWMVGIGLKWNLLDGSLRLKKIKAASFKTKQVDEFHQKATADIGTMIEKLYRELQMYREQLRELETEVQFADEYLRVREKAFHQEMSNETEVVDARLALAKVSIDRLQAMYGYDITLAHLLQYAGVPEQFNDYRTRKEVKTETYKSINE